MYVLTPEQKFQIINLLVEGNSLRSISRITGVHRDTISRLLLATGDKCRMFLDEKLRGLRVKHLQIDEIWTFVAKKEAMVKPWENRKRIGDQYLWVAIDEDTKLFACYAIGKRTSEVANAFMLDLAGRVVTDIPQISTDGWQGYPQAIGKAFGENVDYGILIKDFAEPEQPGRYGPPVMLASERRVVMAGPEFDRWSICTSHVERNNLTIRTFMRRFTRLSLGFSKKLECLAAAVALHVAYYNFCWQHGSLEGATPAMAAGVVNELWSLDNLLASID
jgi:IS1 family transposase